MIPVKGRGSNPAQEHEGPQPYFDVADADRNVTAIATQTALLHCRVKDLGIKAVSVLFWLQLQFSATDLMIIVSQSKMALLTASGIFIFATRRGQSEVVDEEEEEEEKAEE